MKDLCSISKWWVGKVSRRKEIIKIRSEINEKKNEENSSKDQ